MLARRLRSRTNIEPILGERLVWWVGLPGRVCAPDEIINHTA